MDVIELLVGLGASVNGEESETVEKTIIERRPPIWDDSPYECISREDRPLYNACHSGQKEAVEYLLQNGAIVQDEDVCISFLLSSAFPSLPPLDTAFSSQPDFSPPTD